MKLIHNPIKYKIISTYDREIKPEFRWWLHNICFVNVRLSFVSLVIHMIACSWLVAVGPEVSGRNHEK